MKKLTAFLLAMMLVMSMVGCGGNDSGDGAENTTGTAAVTGETAYPLEVQSSDGRTVTVEAEPMKIVSIAPNLTEMLYDLDAEDKLVGRSDYCDYPAEAAEIESIGTLQTPDVEKIISLEPDLVFASGVVAEDMIQKLADVGVAIIMIEDAANLEGVYDVMTLVGSIINRNEEAAALVGDMKATIAEVEEKVAGLEAPSTYYVISYGEYGDATATGDTYIHDILTTAGADNIAKDLTGWAINLEEIVEHDPEVIILPVWYDGMFQTADHYADLTAVKEGKVYVVDSNTIDRQGYRNAEAVRTLAEILHPEAFK